MAYELAEFDAIPWTEADEARPEIAAPEKPEKLSERGERVLKANARLRGTWDGTRDGYPSDSERAMALAYFAGHAGLTMEDATWLLCDLYSRPGKKKLHKSKLAKTLRAWAKGREEASRDEAQHPQERHDERKAEAEADAGIPQETRKRKEGAQPYEMLSLAEFRRASFVGATRLVPSVGLIVQGVGVLAAPGGHGKSVAVLNLICGWAGAKVPLTEAIPATRRLRILGFQVENPAGIEQERINRILRGPDTPDGVYLFTRTEPIRFSLAKGRPNQRALERLAATLARYAPVDLVTFDPLIHLHEAEENSASEMMRWLVPVREVCRQAGAAIIVVHHAGWAPDGEDARGRGTTAIRAWSDFELALRRETRNGKPLYRMNLIKANFAPLWKEHLTLEFDEENHLFHPVDEAATLCSADALLAWVTEDLNGIWEGKRGDLYAMIRKQFTCSDKTARDAVAAAIREGKLKDHGQRKALEVVANSQGTLV